MNKVYQKHYEISATAVDRFGRLKPGHLLSFVQDAAGDHSKLLGTGRDALDEKHLFWAVIRHRVQISRLPGSGEKITLETWPMPTTRTAYPRASIAFDREGKELFRCVSLWVLMDQNTRAMVLPGKSGIALEGLVRGNELAIPGSLMPKTMEYQMRRTVRFTDLDINGHMNNCRYLDWVTDLLPSSFHKEHSMREFSVSYLSEVTEGTEVTLNWEFHPEGFLVVDSLRQAADSADSHRVFAARVEF